MDSPLAQLPASYLIAAISLLSTAFFGVIGWIVKRFFGIAAEELKTAKDALLRLNDEVLVQRTNHLSHIEDSGAKTVTLLEAFSKEQQETNGYLRALCDRIK